MEPNYHHSDVDVVHAKRYRPIESFYGEETTARTAIGRLLLKKFQPGDSRKFVDLVSHNDRKIWNVHLEWIGEIFSIVPARKIRRLNAGPKQGVLALPVLGK
jgi:repressor LexA